MKAAVIEQHSKIDDKNGIVFKELSVPEPSETQCLIRVKACGLNHLDTWVRRGVPGHKFPLPLVPGSDITGIIEKPSKSSRWKAGDRVIVNPGLSCRQCKACLSGNDHLCQKWGLLGETQDGGCREYVAVEEHQVFGLPPKLSFEQGACIPITYVTAWQMLVGKCKIEQGQSILIHAAGSGVSIACVQIARLFGLQIFVTSTSDEKLSQAKALGAHRFINSKKESFREAVKNLTGKQGVDIIVDHIGAPTFMDSIRCLRRGGKLVSCGATAGAEITLDWKHVFFKNLSLIGSTYGHEKDFVEVLKAFEEGKLVPVVDSTVALSDLMKAHAAIESRKVFGKVIVVF